MTTTTQHEATQPETGTDYSYPTIADKVALLRANGIDIVNYFENREDDLKFQSVKFSGDRTVADHAIDVARQHGLLIIELSHVQDYDGKHPEGDAHWWLMFDDPSHCII